MKKIFFLFLTKNDSPFWTHGSKSQNPSENYDEPLSWSICSEYFGRINADWTQRISGKSSRPKRKRKWILQKSISITQEKFHDDQHSSNEKWSLLSAHNGAHQNKSRRYWWSLLSSHQKRNDLSRHFLCSWRVLWRKIKSHQYQQNGKRISWNEKGIGKFFTRKTLYRNLLWCSFHHCKKGWQLFKRRSFYCVWGATRRTKRDALHRK